MAESIPEQNVADAAEQILKDAQRQERFQSAVGQIFGFEPADEEQRREFAERLGDCQMVMSFIIVQAIDTRVMDKLDAAWNLIADAKTILEGE